MKIYQFNEKEILELINDINSFEKNSFKELNLQEIINKLNKTITTGKYTILHQ
jgi:hypothetical protein